VSLTNRRLERERKTMEVMLVCYCRGFHGSIRGLCSSCAELLDYATGRLDRCPFQEEKPTCVKCPIHCYQAQRREQVRVVMRYSGPRIFWRHPVLSILHFLDARREAPVPPKR
jgi:hypothetical protein